MNVIRLLYIACAKGYYRWAMREIDPLSEDVPGIVMRLHQLDAQQRRMGY